ncbi:S9 family peptidase [Undibacterium parvum]|uniref:S9 family peptidase n=1 Tax=Undibacterium parvum TaxID=401471 RepID=A0A3Q9BS15_9BURK|nr:S9 family peptidase [Undibacterium parvum]AZP13061.1 S9 family peptidase [Undibacterium parvum]
MSLDFPFKQHSLCALFCILSGLGLSKWSVANNTASAADLNKAPSAVPQGMLSLEGMYHPTKKLSFETVPLTQLSWDKQDRLIESQTKDGITQLFVINPDNWEKQILPLDGNLLGILKTAAIDDKQALKIAEKLAPQISPQISVYLFNYQNDIWLLDLKNQLARALTSTPEVAEDEALLSPDFKSVAYLKGNDLYVTDLASSQETRLTSGGSETVFNGRLDWVYQEEVYGRGSFRAFYWSPDSQRIAFLSLDETKVPLYTLAGEHAQPLKTNLTRYPKAGDPNPLAKLGVVDLQARLSWVADPYPGQESLIVQVGWTPDGKLLSAWQDRVQTWLDLRINTHNNESKLILRESSPAWTERLPLPHFLKDGSFIWESDRTGHRHLYRYLNDQGKFTLQAAVTEGDWDVRHVYGIDQNKGKVYFSANAHNPIGVDLYATNLQGGNPQRLSSEGGAHKVRWNASFTHYLDSWSGLRQTPKQALFSDNGALLKLVDDQGTPENMRGLKLATLKQQQIKARDAHLLESLLFLPPDFDPSKKYPVYQHLYAGPMAPQVIDRWTSNLWHHFLAQQGYIVWILDNRSASNKGVVSAWPIHKKLGQLELQDQLDGLEWLRSQGWADMQRIALNGWSYGGYFTSYAMTHSQAWKIGLAGAPVTDFRLYDSIYTERYMGLPKDNATGYDQGSVLKAAKDLSGKLLIMHGTMDDNVHPQNSIMLIDALIKNGKDYELQLYPNSDHSVRGDWETWSLQKAKWNFIKNNL